MRPLGIFCIWKPSSKRPYSYHLILICLLPPHPTSWMAFSLFGSYLRNDLAVFANFVHVGKLSLRAFRQFYIYGIPSTGWPAIGLTMFLWYLWNCDAISLAFWHVWEPLITSSRQYPGYYVAVHSWLSKSVTMICSPFSLLFSTLHDSELV